MLEIDRRFFEKSLAKIPLANRTSADCTSGGVGVPTPIKGDSPPEPFQTERRGGWIVRQGRRQIKAAARECTMYSTEPMTSKARDCPQDNAAGKIHHLLAYQNVFGGSVENWQAGRAETHAVIFRSL